MAKEIQLTEFREEFITETRKAKIQQLIARRQNFAVVLENVHDPHNIGAVLRSCDAVGVGEVYLLYTEAMHAYHREEIGKNASSGARKWVNVHYYFDVEECFYTLRNKYQKILGTHLSANASSLYSLDLTEKIALMFGNEHLGISDDSLSRLDGNFIIPQFGMVQSLNISVACAVTLFEASRQRQERTMYEGAFDEANLGHLSAFQHLVNRHFDENQKR
ncbi:MAG: RNA methyltransferase [Saprospiraceae bacterium]|jgi:tRNA (guanosine-2'-O-)-methyltransferase|nr:RNA methyltransferase [Saprospiraceae bacterium]